MEFRSLPAVSDSRAPPPISSDSGAHAPLPLWSRRQSRTGSSRQALDRIARRQQLAAAVGAAFQLDLALAEALGPDQDLPGNADQVGRSEFRARAFVEVVVEHLDAPAGKLAVEAFARRIGCRIALLEIEDGDLEGRHRLRPFDPGIVVERLDY